MSFAGSNPRSAPAPRRRPRRRGVRVLVVAIAVFVLMAAMSDRPVSRAPLGWWRRGCADDRHGRRRRAGRRRDGDQARSGPPAACGVLWRCPHPDRLLRRDDEPCLEPGWPQARLHDGRDRRVERVHRLAHRRYGHGKGRAAPADRVARLDAGPTAGVRSTIWWRRSIRQLGCVFPAGVAWSPDSRQLAYSCTLPGPRAQEVGFGPHPRAGIFVIRDDGSGRRAIPTGTERSDSPSWSPDGRRIAFTGCTSCSTAGSTNVYVVNLNGTGRRLVARDGDSPTWSPNGRTIAYRGTCGIKLVTPAGKDVTPPAVAAGCGVHPRGYPAWSLDGKRIAIGTQRGVYLINADGSGLVRVTRVEPGTPGFGTQRPAWTPTPRVVHSRQVPPVRSPCC